MKLYLASQSPRRRQLLAKLPYTFECLASSFDERSFEERWHRENPKASVERVAEALASAKAQSAVLPHGVKSSAAIILAADTIVVLDNEIFGKGLDRRHSMAMLQRLAAHTHQVYTALALLLPGGDLVTHIERSDVSFSALKPEEIAHYVDREKPFDKAGAYGIQDAGAHFVKSISGDYENVVGLPLRALRSLLAPFEADLQR